MWEILTKKYRRKRILQQRETDIIAIITEEIVKDKEIYIEKTDVLGSFIDKIISSFSEIDESEEYHLFYREVCFLKNEYSSPENFMMVKGESLPLLLTVFIKVFEEKIDINIQNVEKIISEIQKHVFLENNEFLSVKPFLKLAALYIFGESAAETIRTIDEINEKELLNKFSFAERLFLNEKSGIYKNMDEKSKSFYRYKLSEYAKKEGKTEIEAAKEIIEKSGRNHLGGYLFKSSPFEEKRKTLGNAYLISLFLFPLFFSLGVALLSKNILAFFFSFVAFYPASKNILERVFLRFSKPLFLPGIKIGKTIAEDKATAVVISLLLYDSIDFLKLKNHIIDEYLKAPKGEVYFNLLCDLKESQRKETDEDKEIIEKVSKIIKELNEEYENKFSLIVRKRRYSDTMKCYIGRNRKRGAVGEICAYISGETPHFYKTEGEIKNLLKCKYMILLDSDTEMTLGAATRLISAAAHPLNKPLIEDGKVVRGCGIIAPRMAVNPICEENNLFALLFSGERGISHYSDNIRDLGNELFLKTIFSGKGIINIEAFHKITADVFKDEEVLSHDILEGSLLRCGFASDVVFLESFPKSFESFLKRNDRWIRGDFQNLIFLSDIIKNRFYEKIKTPFSKLDKIRILENCIRELSPFFTLLILILSFFSYGKRARFLFVVGMFLIPFSTVSRFLILALRRIKKRKKYFILEYKELISKFSLAAVELSLLPISAFNSIKAAVNGLYRVFYSKKDMLLWTPADKADKEVVSLLKTAAPSLVLGAFFLLSFKTYIRVAGIFFLFSPYVLLLLRKSKKEKEPTNEEKFKLKKEAGLIWNFFNDYAVESENYLPPDNVSYFKKETVSHKTSPTNIGLYLLSVAGAYTLDFISLKEQNERINNCLSTVEKLEKYKGHLYNWYNTETLEILEPRFVSSVDSGNFIACLRALRTQIEDRDIKERLTKLINNMHFSIFYNENKKLFSIGIDGKTGERSQHHYDMLFSEARTLSFMAVASKEVKKEHINYLQRLFSKNGTHSGPLSWSGTAFEYFMPTLFLPTLKDTIYDLAYKYAFYSQKKKGDKNGTPFGNSESAYYDFDDNLNYMYKAHGVAKLSVRTDNYKDNVVSPYSTFLMMQEFFKESYKNYTHLKNEGFSGKYGLYEAIDYTAERTGEKAKIIKSYMAHHIGMSFLSLVNILSDFSIRKGFMNDKGMYSGREILWEKIPEEVELYPTGDEYEKRETTQNFKIEEYLEFNPETPRVSAISSGAFTLTVADSGASELNFCGKPLIKPPRNLFSNSGGFFAAVGLEKTYPITAFPFYDSEKRKTVFGGYFISHYLSKRNFESGICYKMTENALEINLGVKNKTKKKLSGNFEFSFEPIFSVEKSENGLIFFNEEGENIYLFPDASSEISLSEKCLIKIPFELSKNGEITKKIIISLGKYGETSGEYTETFLRENSEMGKLAFSLLGKLIYGGRDSRNIPLLRKYNKGDKTELYKANLTGDFPVVCFELSGVRDLKRLENYINVWKAFRLYSMFFDLCILVSKESELIPGLEKLLSQLSVENSISKQSGIHILKLSLFSETTINTLKAYSSHLFEKNAPSLTSPIFNFKKIEIIPQGDYKEFILINYKGKYYNPIPLSKTVKQKEKTEYYFTVEKLKAKISVFKNKIITIELESGEKQEIGVAYVSSLDNKEGKMTKLTLLDNGILAYNPFSKDKLYTFVKANRKVVRIIDKTDFFFGRWEESRLGSQVYPIVALVAFINLNGKESVSFEITSAKTETEVLK